MTDFLAALRDGLRTGRMVPYLGPKCLNLGNACTVPASPAALAEALQARIALPARTRGNPWSSAQFIESRRHRKTLEKMMADIFSAEIEPNALHVWLAEMHPQLIVDAWYDDTMARACSEDWGQIQAVTRNGKREDIWYRALLPDGKPADLHAAAGWRTILYRPHGAVKPSCEFLLSDSDYVEVLTEIDIQTPIPQAVIERRASRGFAFFGCRFVSQTERIFARQIMKRSAGPHYAVISGELSRNEVRFLDEQNIVRIDMPLAEVAAYLCQE